MSRGRGEDGEDLVELFQPLSLQIQCGQVIVDSPDLRRLAISPDGIFFLILEKWDGGTMGGWLSVGAVCIACRS